MILNRDCDMNAKTLLAYLHLFKVGMVEGCRQGWGGGGGNYEYVNFFLSVILLQYSQKV